MHPDDPWVMSAVLLTHLWPNKKTHLFVLSSCDMSKNNTTTTFCEINSFVFQRDTILQLVLRWQPCYFESFEESLRAAFTSYHLCGFVRQCWCLRMRLTLPLDNILFTIMPSIARTALTLCFMSSVNAATAVGQPIHCSHLYIKCLPALSDWTCTECLFQHCSAISCTYFQFHSRPWILMETYIISLPGRPVETQRGHSSAGYSVLRFA